jgi:hypothetical protein
VFDLRSLGRLQRAEHDTGGLYDPNQATSDDDFAIQSFDLAAFDQTIFTDCDALLQESNSYVEKIESMKCVSPIRPGKSSNGKEKVVNQIKNLTKLVAGGSVSKESTALDSSSYERLVARVNEAERKILDVLDDAVMNQSSLITQGDHLRSRLVSCIRYNQGSLAASEARSKDSRVLVSQLSQLVQTYKDTLKFYDEIMYQKSRQVEAYVPWAMRKNNGPQMQSDRSLADCVVFDRHETKRRLNRLIKVTNTCHLDTFPRSLPTTTQSYCRPRSMRIGRLHTIPRFTSCRSPRWIIRLAPSQL